eukprot:580401-Rhodomonas_salina.2
MSHDAPELVKRDASTRRQRSLSGGWQRSPFWSLRLRARTRRLLGLTSAPRFDSINTPGLLFRAFWSMLHGTIESKPT